MAQITSRDELRQVIDAYQLARCVQVAAELGVADLLKDGPKPTAELARVCQAHPQALFRLMRALASAGIFVQQADGCFALNAVADYLSTDCRGSLRAWALLAGQQHYPTWRHLLYSVRSGASAFDDLHGMSVWQYRADDAAAGRVFDDALGAHTGASAQAVVEAYDFSRVARVVDVGGGLGTLMSAILRANPGVHGVVFDQAQVIERGQKTLEAADVLERCDTVAGDFCESVAAAGDLYILQRVLHDWDDAAAARILANCRRAMQAHQTLLLIERVLAPDSPTVEAALTDLMMMVMNGGRERTEREFDELLAAGGFRLTRVTPTRSVLSLIEGHAV